jgi:hypothetical protein
MSLFIYVDLEYYTYKKILYVQQDLDSALIRP